MFRGISLKQKVSEKNKNKNNMKIIKSLKILLCCQNLNRESKNRKTVRKKEKEFILDKTCFYLQAMKPKGMKNAK